MQNETDSLEGIWSILDLTQRWRGLARSPLSCISYCSQALTVAAVSPVGLYASVSNVHTVCLKHRRTDVLARRSWPAARSMGARRESNRAPLGPAERLAGHKSCRRAGVSIGPELHLACMRRRQGTLADRLLKRPYSLGRGLRRGPRRRARQSNHPRSPAV